MAMSELQLALIGVGAVVMVSVVAYNKVQERRFFSRQAEREAAVRPPEFPTAETAATAETLPPQEPSLDREPLEHHLGLPEPELTDDTVPLPIARGILDARIDYIASLSFVASHLGEEVLRRASETVKSTKSVEWEGFSETGRAWEPIVPAQPYRGVRVGLQLIDRRGVATEGELLDFCQSLQALAVTLVAEIEFPSRAEALKLAAELDRQIAELDIQVALNAVKLGGPAVSGAAVQHAAQSIGAVLDAEGRYGLNTEEGAQVFAVSNLEPQPFRADRMATLSTRGLTISMDVPRAPDSAEAFQHFVSFSRDLARSLDADLVDDNRRPISTASLDAIAAEVSRVRRRLSELSMPAGSPLALRVFT